MTYVYPNTISTFKGDRDIALENGYHEVEDSVYSALVETSKMWVQNGDVWTIEDDPTYPARKAEEEEEERRRQERQAIIDEVNQLKKNLADTDYCVIKIAEGVATKEEYAEVIAQRATWRERINELINEVSE